MSEEIVKVIKIDGSQATQSLNDIKNATDDTGQSFNNLGEYKKHINSLKASLLDLDETSEEYKSTLDEIRSAQNKLDKVMADCRKTTDAAEGSYNALTQQMAELKKQWKATTDEAKRTDLGKQINAINDQLKELDASTGNFQRNVGNYEQAFTEAFSKVADGIDAIVPGTKQATQGVMDMGSALNSLKKNPIVAIAATIIAALTTIKKSFEANESATNRVKVVWEKLKIVLEPVRKAFLSIADAIATLAEKALEKLPRVLRITENIANGVVDAINFISIPFRKLYSNIIKGIAGIVGIVDKVLPGEQKKLVGVREALKTASDRVEDFTIGHVSLQGAIDKTNTAIGTNINLGEEAVGTIEKETTAIEALKAQIDKFTSSLTNSGTSWESFIDLILGTNLDSNTSSELKEQLSSLKSDIVDLIKGEDLPSDQYMNKLGDFRERFKPVVEYIANLRKSEALSLGLSEAKSKKEREEAEKYAQSIYEGIISGYENSFDRVQNLKAALTTDLNNVAFSEKNIKENEEVLAKIEAQAIEAGIPTLIYAIQKKREELEKAEEENSKQRIKDKIKLLDDEEKALAQKQQLDNQLITYQTNDEFKRRQLALTGEQEYLEQLKGIYEEKKALYAEDTEEYQAYAEKIKEIESNITLNEQSQVQFRKEIEQWWLESRMEVVNAAINSLSSVENAWSSIIEAEKAKIEEDRELTEAEKQEYIKKKEALAAFQIASVIVSSAAASFDIWRGYAAEKVVNAETAAATGPAAAITLAALNAKSLISAIVNQSMIAAQAAASIASIQSGLSGTKSSMKSSSTGVSSAGTAGTSYATSYDFANKAEATREGSTLSTLETATDTRVYILESDIKKSSERVQIREENTTW